MRQGSNMHGASPVQWTVWVAMFIAFIGALYMGNAVGTGNYSRIYLIFLALGGMSIALFVGQRYWLLGIACFSLNIPLVALGIRAIELPEVGAVYLFGSYLLMLAFHRNFINLGKLEYAGFFLFIALVTLTLALHPIGLLGFGSQVGGARSYMKVYMALGALIVLSNQIVSDKDLRWVVWFMVGGAFISTSWGLFDYFVLGGTVQDEADQIYSWHQILAGVPFMVILWCFARYRPSEIVAFKHPLRLGLMLLCVAVTFESGKRGMVASIGLIPVISAIINRQWRYVYFLSAVLLAVIAVIVIGQGGAFSLPLRAQRSLMYLPADWDSEIQRMKAGGSMDEFRKEMRRLAWDKAMESPWLGEGFAFDLDETRGMGTGSLQSDPTGILSIGRAWHSLWFGLAADFGFLAWPCYLLIYITMIWVSLWIIARAPPNSHTRTVTMMLFISMLINIFKSYTSGHSANTPFGEWWAFGLLIAIRYSLIAQEHLAQQELRKVNDVPAALGGEAMPAYRSL